MQAELDALMHNDTWTLVPLSTGHKPIGCKWVYKIKYHSDGSVERYKARLVAKGYTQLEGIDYQETFSPTAKLTTVRCLLAIAASRNWFLSIQLMFKMPFFMVILMRSSTWMFPLVFADRGRIWYVGSTSPCNKEHAIKSLKDTLLQQFRIKDLGNLKYFLGIEVSRCRKGIFVSQRKYALDILKDAGLLGSCPNSFPMEEHLKLNPEDGELLHDPTKYRRLVGRLIYLTVTRPDIVYSVQILSQFMQNPHTPHWEAALRVLRFIKGNPGQGLFFPSFNDLILKAYCDSDWARCMTTRRSVS
ncbi:uncharacterized protein LOC110771952 [Prunus avium]|uniref:Uncharacterized protein LOC110771952 n=1 Tax=Prunus avium TaxID=42229 RepID=A0A6P5TYV6_PRUAV|nr:uncharacterized protein LOC110771952 [Prunus avium]